MAFEKRKEKTYTQKGRILITGGSGFVGSHFVEEALKTTDWDIVVLDAINYASNLHRVTDISVYTPERVSFVYHDLRSPINDMIHEMIGELDYVVHFAAESHVDRSLKDALPFAMSNVVGTTNLLEYLKNKQPNLKRYIGFNTDEVFGAAPEGIYHTEDYKFKPSNPYAAAKGGQWCMEYAFAHAFSMPITMVHCMNIIGERQHPEKFLPLVIKKLLNREKITLHGVSKYNLSSRCWIHARNVADGVMFLLENGKNKESYNIVGEEKTVYDIANWVCQSVLGRDLKDEDIEWLDFHRARPGHDKRYALDGKKIAKLGWTPPVTLRKSIKKTVQWSLKNKNKHWINL